MNKFETSYRPAGIALPGLDSRLRHFSRIAGGTVLLMGGVVLTGGWLLGIEALRSIPLGSVSMKANTALGLAAAGVALWLLQEGVGGRRLRAGRVCAALPALIGLLTLAEYFLGRGLGIDELLFMDRGAGAGPIPGRPALTTAIAFILLGMSFFTLDRETRRGWHITDWFALGAGLFALFGLLEFIAGDTVLIDSGAFTVMALLTAIAVLLLAAGQLTGRPRLGLIRDLSSAKEDNSTAHRPVIIGFMIALGLLAYVTWMEWQSSVRMQKTAAWVVRIEEAQDHLSFLLVLLEDIETGAHAIGSTGDPGSLDRFASNMKTVVEQQRKLEQLIVDDEQKASLSALEPLIAERIAAARRIVEVRQRLGVEAARQEVASGRGKAVTDQIRAGITRMEGAEQKLLTQHSAAVMRAARTTRRLAVAATGVSFALLIAALTLLLRESRLRRGTNLVLRESEERFRGTFEQAAVGIAHVGLDGRLLFANQRLCEMLGYPPEELSRLTFQDITYADDLDLDLSDVRRRRMLEGELPHYSVRKRYWRKDGSLIWIDLTVSMIRTLSGEPHYFVSVWLDISARIQAEEAIRYQSEFHRVAGEISTALVNLPEGGLDEAINDALQKIGALFCVDRSYLFRFSDDLEALSNTHEWCVPGIEPLIHVTQHFPSAQVSHAMEKFRRGEPFHVPDVDTLPAEAAAELRELRRKGIQSLMWLPMARNHKLLGFVGFDAVARKRTWTESETSLLQVLVDTIAGALLRDQAEAALRDANATLEQRVAKRTAALEEVNRRLRRSEAELQRAQSIAHVGSWYLDLGRDELLWSPESCRIFGVPPGTLTTYSRFLASVHPDDRQSVDEEWQAALRGTVYDIEHRICVGEETKWVREHAELEIDAAGSPVTAFGTVQDITARKLAEIERAWLYDVVARSLNEVYVFDTETLRFRFVNLGACRNLGYTQEELAGLTPVDLKPEFTAETFRAMLEPLRTGDRPALAFESVHRRKDGSEYLVDVHLQLVKAGVDTVFLAVINDITERKQAEQKLRWSRDLLELTGRMAKIGGWEVDVDTQTLSWTEEVYRIHEVDPAVRLNVAEAVEFYAPEARPAISAAVSACIDAGAPWDLELPLITAQDRRIWVRAQGAAVRQDGRTVRLHGAFQDITERKQTTDAILREKAFSEVVLESLPGIFCIFDQTGRFLRWNRLLETVSGYSAEEIADVRPGDFFHEEDRTWIGETIGKVFEGGAAEFEATLVAKDGRKTPYYFIGGRIDVDGVPCLIWTGIDVTARIHLETQLRQAKKVEAVGQLAGGIAHDFNNILAVIMIYGELALRQLELEHPVRARVDKMMKAAEQAAGLTRQLLAFSRKQVIQPTLLDLNDIVAGTNKMLGRLLGEDIDIVVRPSPGLGTVKADAGQIEQIIMNLAVNARDAMPKGGSLTLETNNVDLGEEYAATHPDMKPGRYVLLAVSDTGIGMDAETQLRIFEPFFTTKPEGKGTGLGLATVYGIVKQSGGGIQVYSEPGRGTTFKVYLPRVDEPAEATPAAVPQSIALRGHETILLVEDNEALREVIRDTLEGSGYTVLPASNGEEGLAVARECKGPIDLLLTDVVMPKLGGADLAKLLSGLRPGIRVLFMSGYTDGAITQHGVLLEGAVLLQKPFTVDKVALAVREALARPIVNIERP